LLFFAEVDPSFQSGLALAENARLLQAKMLELLQRIG
jgi:hypothetical protein